MSETTTGSSEGGGGVRRPNFKPNVQANVNITKSRSRFYDIPAGTTNAIRFLPPSDEKGLIFTLAAQHYGFKNPEMDGNFALACLDEHGNDETGVACWVCEFINVLKNNFADSDPAILSIVKGKGSSSLATNYYSKILGLEKQRDGAYTYSGPDLFRLPSTGKTAVTDIMSEDEATQQVSFLDADKGQALNITNFGKSPWYKAARSGIVASLDEVFPAWVKAASIDVTNELNLKVVTREAQREAAVRTFENVVDFDLLASKYGL